MEHVILVDKQDKPIGLMPKMEAHEKGELHRAFSIFVFNSKGELLLQKRALNKYHSAGLWSNTCCSHPRYGESLIGAANRRLEEEMGMKCELKKVFDFIYKTPFENGLTEHEFDHVFFGQTDFKPNINKDEVVAWNYFSMPEIEVALRETPAMFTTWFKICFDRVKQYINERKSQHILV